MVNNVASLGHAHPRLIAAVAEQRRLLNTNSRFHYRLDRRVLRPARAPCCPTPLDTVFLVNSGSEAVDLALRIGPASDGPARRARGRRRRTTAGRSLTDAVSTSVADNPQAPRDPPGLGAHRRRAEPATAACTAAPTRDRYADDAARRDRAARRGRARPPAPSSPRPFYGNAGGIALPDGYLDDGLRRRARARRARDRRRGAGRLRPARRVVLGLRAAGRRSRRRHRRQGDGQRPSARRRHHHAARSPSAYRTQGYFFSSAGGSPVSSAVGLAVLDVIARRAAAGERARGRRAPQGAPRPTRRAASD